MKKPSNTTQQDPRVFLADAMTVGSSNAIELQEAQGQKELAMGDTLPTEMGAGDKAALEEEGFFFLGPVEGDPLFQYVRFPQIPRPWHIVPDEHPMWSSLVDGDGTIRGRIFYKAAFYDRHAHLYLERI